MQVANILAELIDSSRDAGTLDICLHVITWGCPALQALLVNRTGMQAYTAGEDEAQDRQGDSAAIIAAQPEHEWGLQPDNVKGLGSMDSVPEFLACVRKGLRLYLALLLQVMQMAHTFCSNVKLRSMRCMLTTYA